MYVRLISIVLLAVASGCQSTSEEHTDHSGHSHSALIAKEGPVAVLEKQVLATHDSIMPAMSTLMKLEKAVAAKIETQPLGPAKEQGKTIGRNLTESDEGMMKWMNQYDGDTLSKLNEAQALAYLRSQQIRVIQVRDQMRRSIADAQAYLRQQP